jgi:hypothetical protein
VCSKRLASGAQSPACTISILDPAYTACGGSFEGNNAEHSADVLAYISSTRGLTATDLGASDSNGSGPFTPEPEGRNGHADVRHANGPDGCKAAAGGTTVVRKKPLSAFENRPMSISSAARNTITGAEFQTAPRPVSSSCATGASTPTRSEMEFNAYGKVSTRRRRTCA